MITQGRITKKERDTRLERRSTNQESRKRQEGKETKQNNYGTVKGRLNIC